MSTATDTLIHFGSEIKLVGETADAWQIAGWAVPFGPPDLTSLKDVFDRETDYDITDGDARTIYFHHGLDDTLKRTKLGTATFEVKDAGVWYQGQIKKRQDWLKVHTEKIVEGIKQGVFTPSTGAIVHLVDREPLPGGGHHVKMWPIGELSVTAQPASPYTTAEIKTLDDLSAAAEWPAFKASEALDGLLSSLAARWLETKADNKPAADSGHWVTIDGHPVYIQDKDVDQDEVYAAGVQHGLSENGHKHLDLAHKRGDIVTNTHLHHVIAGAKRLMEQGTDEDHAFTQAIRTSGWLATHADELEKHERELRNYGRAAMVQSRKDKREAFLSKGQDIVDYVSDHADSIDEAQNLARDLGYRSTTWDDQRNNARREQERKRGAHRAALTDKLKQAQEKDKAAPEQPAAPSPAPEVSSPPRTVYRTEKAHSAYKGKANYGEGVYYGTDRKAVGEMQLDPNRETVDEWTPKMGGVTVHAVSPDLKLKKYDLENMTPDEFRAMPTGEAMKQQALAEGYEGVHILTGGDLNLGGDQVVVYKNHDKVKPKDGRKSFDDDFDTPELDHLEAGQLEGSRFIDHSARVLAACGEYQERVADLFGERASNRKSGRVLSATNHERLTQHHASLQAMCDDLKELLDRYGPEGESPSAGDEPDPIKAMSEQAFLNYRLLEMKLNGVLV